MQIKVCSEFLVWGEGGTFAGVVPISYKVSEGGGGLCIFCKGAKGWGYPFFTYTKKKNMAKSLFRTISPADLERFAPAALKSLRHPGGGYQFLTETPRGVSIFYTYKKKKKNKAKYPFCAIFLPGVNTWFAPAALKSFLYPGVGGTHFWQRRGDQNFMETLKGGVCIFMGTFPKNTTRLTRNSEQSLN